MKNNKFLFSTFVLMLGGLITKILGFIIRILYVRIAGAAAIDLYTIVTPTYSLLVTIAAGCIPVVIAKFVSEGKYKTDRIIRSAIVILIGINLILILFILIFSKTIAIYFLKEPRAYIIIKSMALTLPFISISSILKGYFYGKQKMIPNVVSNILEQLLRILLIIIVIPKLLNYSISLAVMGLILFSVITEILSIFVFSLFLPNKKRLNLYEFKHDIYISKQMLKMTLPMILERLVGNVGFCLEPIILSNILINQGFSNSYVLTNYGTYNAYCISLLALPSFFIGAISNASLPEISRFFAKKDYRMFKKRVKQTILFTLFLGVFFTSFIIVWKDYLLQILYKSTRGSSFISILGPFFVLFYLEGPLSSILQAIGKAKTSFLISFFGIIIKIIFLIIFCFNSWGIYSLIYAEIINIIVVVSLEIFFVNKNVRNFC